MTANNAQVIHSLCTEQADAFAGADDLLPESYQNNPGRILAACLIAHALDLNPATVMFGLHQKTPPAPAQKAEKQEKPEKSAEVVHGAESWPQKIDGVWTDSTGTVFNASTHAFNKKTKTPSVKANGTFRHARGNGKARPADKAPEVPAHDDEQVLVDANQVLGSFQTHVADAGTSERLEQIGEQLELMGFNPSELTIARRWIAERAEAIAAN